jgi:hypothetical protein
MVPPRKDLIMIIYHGEWKTQKDMCRDFNIDECNLQGCTIIYASYDHPPYEGYAFVIFEKSGDFYEVNASHCSCYGLEGKWKPEENDYEALMARPNVPEIAKNNLKWWNEWWKEIKSRGWLNKEYDDI